jgi:hypothetical protein
MKYLVLIIFLVFAGYAIWRVKPNGWTYFLLLISTAVGVALIYNVDTIRKLSTKYSHGELQAEWEHTKEEVYVKLETVRKMGEGVAELATFAALQVGRYSPPDLQAQLLQNKSRIAALMQQIGADKEKVKSISDQFDKRVADDLRHNISHAVQRATKCEQQKSDQGDGRPSFNRGEVIAEAERRLALYSGNEQDRKALLSYLEQTGITDEAVIAALNELDHFLRTQELMVKVE